MNKAEYIGKAVIEAMKRLKDGDDPLDLICPVCLYLADDDYDVFIDVRLLPKRTQKELIQEMVEKVGRH